MTLDHNRVIAFQENINNIISAYLKNHNCCTNDTHILDQVITCFDRLQSLSDMRISEDDDNSEYHDSDNMDCDDPIINNRKTSVKVFSFDPKLRLVDANNDYYYDPFHNK